MVKPEKPCLCISTKGTKKYSLDFFISADVIHSNEVHPFIELIIIKKNALITIYTGSWLIGA